MRIPAVDRSAPKSHDFGYSEFAGAAMKNDLSFRSLLKRVHNDERGAVSLETILIIAAIALPILIFLIKFGWPKIKNYFNRGMEDLETESDRAKNAP